MASNTEILEGYVVDVACLRDFPTDELLHRARTHPRSCLTMKHCSESGYGIVDHNGKIWLLDASATPQVLNQAHTGNPQHTLQLRAHRHANKGQMVTERIEEVDSTETSGQASASQPLTTGITRPY